MASSYRGALEDDNKHQVTSINRVSDTTSIDLPFKKDVYDELKDELWGDLLWLMKH